ncbi:carboxylesterase family protein [Streptomyces sp. NPDC127049]|uniref:carboxylesterase family protein n=1 Tax=Streptomyces sp. NPDC127049 TaxID=3347118 RepID=UPI003659A8F6
MGLFPGPGDDGPPLPHLLGALGLDPARTGEFTAAYPDVPEGALLGQALTDVMFRAPGLAVADARAARERPTWLYEFAWRSPVLGLAAHCLDLPFGFDLLDAEGVPEVAGPTPPQALADAVHRAWVAFVTDQDPGADWPRYTPSARATRVWDTESRTETDPVRHVRDLWLD